MATTVSSALSTASRRPISAVAGPLRGGTFPSLGCQCVRPPRLGFSSQRQQWWQAEKQERNLATRVVLREADTDSSASQRGSSPSPAPGSASTGTSKDAFGYLALFGVAVLWGSYTPAIRLLYLIDTPPDPPLLNALQACLSAAFLVAASLTAGLTSKAVFPHPERSNPLMAEDSAVMKAIVTRDKAAGKKRDAATALAAASSTAVTVADPPRRAPSNPVEHAIASALTWRSDSLIMAGAEVGLWMSLAFSLEVAGLQLASATKVAFLNQVSVLVTPLLVHLSGERVRMLEWVACGLGLLGSVLVAVDSLMSGGGGGGHGAHGAAAAGQSNEVLGLIYILISAGFFALSTVRLGRYSSMFDSLKLSTASTCTLGLLSLTWVAASILGRPNGGEYELVVLDNLMSSPVCVMTLIWVGLGPGALAAFLQATGQKSVPPAQAQVIYSTTPLWAAGFAYLALNASDEAMGSIAWVGAAVMLGSSLLTALLPPDDSAAGASQLATSSMATWESDQDSDTESYDHDAYTTDQQYYVRSSQWGSSQLPPRDYDIYVSRSYDSIDDEVRARQGLRDIL